MANSNENTALASRLPIIGIDPAASPSVYRLRLDALTTVARMNRGWDHRDAGVIKRLLVIIQGHLVDAAMLDPKISMDTKKQLIEFHKVTVQSNNEDRRGERDRSQARAL
jgi:hypothetical protein